MSTFASYRAPRRGSPRKAGDVTPKIGQPGGAASSVPSTPRGTADLPPHLRSQIDIFDRSQAYGTDEAVVVPPVSHPLTGYQRPHASAGGSASPTRYDAAAPRYPAAVPIGVGCENPSHPFPASSRGSVAGSSTPRGPVGPDHLFGVHAASVVDVLSNLRVLVRRGARVTALHAKPSAATQHSNDARNIGDRGKCQRAWTEPLAVCSEGLPRVGGHAQISRCVPVKRRKLRGHEGSHW